MILPILAYGDPLLKKEGVEISRDYPRLKEFIADMFETMHSAKGVGLAAPQVGKSVRLFIVDGEPFARDGEHGEMKDFKKIFINATILEEKGEEWVYNEGCLSIPEIREDVKRKEKIRVEYLDENFEKRTEEFEGLQARVIQHEYDHTLGILFTDRISPLRKRLLRRKLNDIARGQIEVNYKMKFPLKK